MALFRRSQNDSIIQNQFWELPDHYWIGTMLMNKHTVMPVGGYDTPIVSAGRLALRGKNVTSTSFSSLDPISTDATTEFSTTYNNGQFFKTFCTGSVMGQCGFMLFGFFPVRFVSPTNNMDSVPKAYAKDPIEPNIVYTQFNGDSIGDNTFLIKYDTETHKVLWCRKNLGSEAFVRMKIFAIQDGMLYILFCGDGVQGMPGVAYTTSNGTVSGVAMTRRMYTYPYHSRAYWGIIRVSTETGDIVGGPIYYPVSVGTGAINNASFPSPGDAHDCQYIGMDENDRDIFLMSRFDTTNMTATSTSNPDVSYRIGYFYYDRPTHTTLHPNGTPLVHARKPFGTTFYMNPISSYSISTYLPKPSSPDRTITDSITCYGFGGTFINWHGAADALGIYKYILQDGVQRFEPMTVLNNDGLEMSYLDWFNLHQVTCTCFSKFYVLYGATTKFLMIYTNPTYNMNDTRGTNDLYGYVAIFKFVDNDTLQLVDSMSMVCTDMLWLKHNVFVAARLNRIRIYSIDLETGKLDMLKNVVPASNSNSFSYACVDELSNLWFLETGIDAMHPEMRQSSLYFINSFTVSRMVIVPENMVYTFSGTEIETYVDIQTIGDLGDPIERDVRLTAVGPMKFKSTNSKAVLAKTSTHQLVRIPFIITGVGDASITMALTAD